MARGGLLRQRDIRFWGGETAPVSFSPVDWAAPGRCALIMVRGQADRGQPRAKPASAPGSIGSVGWSHSFTKGQATE